MIVTLISVLIETTGYDPQLVTGSGRGAEPVQQVSKIEGAEAESPIECYRLQGLIVRVSPWYLMYKGALVP
jgi:hypothetical protein